MVIKTVQIVFKRLNIINQVEDEVEVKAKDISDLIAP
jgi:hypothetical protein